MNKTEAEHAYDCVLDSPLGRVGIRLRDDCITRLDYLGNTAALKPDATPLGRQLAAQLAHYFADPQSRFTLPVELHGTDFQQRVWCALTRIPPGKTLTYGELAGKLGSGARAVGNACRNNPVSIIVPCHRVVSVSGIGGYSGKTDGQEINRKHWLLKHEGISGQALKISRRAPTSGLLQRTQRNLHA
ncbi:MAG: methylated-DNA--[protein]-cysteine S-methyltransferase [Gammaproteobacteria bacterium]|nr:methylated-DNA--[protein]-cysteine S-methyltransferase [Gammaproteobacteria bacterium]